MFYRKLSGLLYTIHAVLNGVNLICLKSSLQCLYCLLCTINFLHSTSRSTRSNFCGFCTLHIIFLAVNLVWGHYCYSPLSLENKICCISIVMLLFCYCLDFFHIVKLFKLYPHIKSREFFAIVILQCNTRNNVTL